MFNDNFKNAKTGYFFLKKSYDDLRLNIIQEKDTPTQV